MFLTDNDRKKISIKTKKIIEETLKKNKKVNNKKLFDIWSSIALQSEIDYENVNFIELNKPWGFNYSKITAYFYNKFITNFKFFHLLIKYLCLYLFCLLKLRYTQL